MGRNGPLSLEFVQKAIQNPLINQTCSQLHGGQCLLRAIKFFGIGMQKFGRLYFLYFLGIFLVFRNKSILKNPNKQIVSFIKSVTRSLLFAGVCLGTGMYVTCILRRIIGNNGEWLSAFTGIIGSIGITIESPQRQPQISLYIFTQALKILYNMGQRRSIIPNVPGGFGLLYALSIAIICYHYINNRELLKKSYLNLIDRLLRDS